MELTTIELRAVQEQEAVALKERQQREIEDLQLAMAGGGWGDTILV